MKNKKFLLALNGVLLICLVILVILLFVKDKPESKDQGISPSPATNGETTPFPDSILTPEATLAPTSTPTPLPTSTPTPSPVPTLADASAYKDYDNTKKGWWFVRNKDHEPSGTGADFDIDQYDAFYLNQDVKEKDLVMYLAFDCGYEYGYTPKILDTLKEKGEKAIFFVTKAFLDSDPDLAIRMKEEGHMVGNHSLYHPSFPTKKVEEVQKEILGCEEQFKQISGYDMDKFIRPPMGEYSQRTLKITQDLGYTSIFWSMAYPDYDVNNQPGKKFVVDYFKDYYHNGAITLIHTISESNTEALGDVIEYLKEKGFRFGTLDEL